MSDINEGSSVSTGGSCETKQTKIQTDAAARKRRKTTAIVALILAGCAALAVLLVTVILPKQKQGKAMDLLASGEYEAAYAMLEELGARDTIASNKYDRAAIMISAGEYEAAYALLNGLPYRDSSSMAAECLFHIQEERLGPVKVGDTLRFGSYEQDNYSRDGVEEIEWIVLAIEGTKALVISKNALDYQRFNRNRVACSWKNCSLRAWLNDAFYYSAFSADHRHMIVASEVAADPNPDYDTNPGHGVTDAVFILSAAEAYAYFDTDKARQCHGTAYCYEAGAAKSDEGAYWWLRTPGQNPNDCTAVTPNGTVYTPGFCVDNDSPAVRPAMWIDIGGD